MLSVKGSIGGAIHVRYVQTETFRERVLSLDSRDGLPDNCIPLHKCHYTHVHMQPFTHARIVTPLCMFFSALHLSNPQLSLDSDTYFHRSRIEMYLGHVCHYILQLIGEGIFQSSQLT